MTLSPLAASTPPDAAPPWFGVPQGQPVKLVAVLALLAVLQVPIWMVSGLVVERTARQDEVLAEYRRGWGPAQVVAGPTLLVPYGVPRAPDGTPGPGGPGLGSGWARLQPSRLKVDVHLQPETRQRGLFRAVVYTARLALSGTVTLPLFAIPGRSDVVADWSRARMVLGVTDPVRFSPLCYGSGSACWTSTRSKLAPSRRTQPRSPCAGVRHGQGRRADGPCVCSQPRRTVPLLRDAPVGSGQAEPGRVVPHREKNVTAVRPFDVGRDDPHARTSAAVRDGGSRSP